MTKQLESNLQLPKQWAHGLAHQLGGEEPIAAFETVESGCSGLQASNDGGDSAVAPLFGDCLIVLAQLAAATQFIVEEKYLAKFKVPALLAVGVEGFWGLVISAIALPLLTVIKGPGGVAFDDAVQAIRVSCRTMPLIETI